MPIIPTVYIVDSDNEILRALCCLFESIHVQVETFFSAQDFLAAYKPGMQGCLVTEVYLPEISGLELQEQLCAIGSNLVVIVITANGDVPMAVRAMKSGAFDFIVKPFNDQLLLERVQAALTTSIKQYKGKQSEIAFLNHLKSLSPREKQVMDLVAHGSQNKVIAQQLGISVKTVELHKHNMMKKMRMQSVAKLIRMLTILELRP